MLKAYFLTWTLSPKRYVATCSMPNIQSNWYIDRISANTKAIKLTHRRYAELIKTEEMNVLINTTITTKCQIPHHRKYIMFMGNSLYKNWTLKYENKRKYRPLCSKKIKRVNVRTRYSFSVIVCSWINRSEYFFRTTGVCLICLYISGWVNIGSSISLWPLRR